MAAKEDFDSAKEDFEIALETHFPKSSVPPVPHTIGFSAIFGMLTTVLPMIIKNLPLIIGVLGGLSGFLKRFKPAPGVEIDQESLAKLIEEITEREVTRIVNENKDRIRVWVPTEEEKERTENLDELEQRLIEDQKRHEREKASREEMERMKEDMKKPQP